MISTVFFRGERKA